MSLILFLFALRIAKQLHLKLESLFELHKSKTFAYRMHTHLLLTLFVFFFLVVSFPLFHLFLPCIGYFFYDFPNSKCKLKCVMGEFILRNFLTNMVIYMAHEFFFSVHMKYNVVAALCVAWKVFYFAGREI